ncbi:MAG: nuclear transport factor 2 family protein [Polyangia bacterium]
MSAGDDALLRRYISTWENRDLDGLVALLAKDAVLSMPPQPEWYVGRAAIRQFLSRMAADPRRYRIRANPQDDARRRISSPASIPRS